MACKHGGGGRSAGPAPGVSAGSSGERGRVTFQLPDSRPIGMVRVYVGKQSGSYDTTLELLDVRRMDALLHPDYTDEEIRREVRNFGITENPADHTLGLEEKELAKALYRLNGGKIVANSSKDNRAVCYSPD